VAVKEKLPPTAVLPKLMSWTGAKEEIYTLMHVGLKKDRTIV
jgi:hypothetical protein